MDRGVLDVLSNAAVQNTSRQSVTAVVKRVKDGDRQERLTAGHNKNKFGV